MNELAVVEYYLVCVLLNVLWRAYKAKRECEMEVAEKLSVWDWTDNTSLDQLIQCCAIYGETPPWTRPQQPSLWIPSPDCQCRSEHVLIRERFRSILPGNSFLPGSSHWCLDSNYTCAQESLMSGQQCLHGSCCEGELISYDTGRQCHNGQDLLDCIMYSKLEILL